MSNQYGNKTLRCRCGAYAMVVFGGVPRCWMCFDGALAEQVDRTIACRKAQAKAVREKAAAIPPEPRAHAEPAAKRKGQGELF